MSAASASELIEFLSCANAEEREELLELAERIVDRHPLGCTDEDMEEIGTLIERLRGADSR